MFGFKDKRLIQKIRLINYLLPLAILLSIVLLIILGILRLDTQVLAPIVIALIGWPLAVDNIFLQINNSLKRKLETEAIRDIDNALTEISDSFSSSITFASDFVVKPLEIPDELWYKAAQEKWAQIAKDTIHMRKAFGKLYRALEAHEIVIIHLEQYYRYLTIIIGDYIEHVDDLNNKFTLATSDWYLSEEKYKEEVAKFKSLHEEWGEIAAYAMDFRKMLQNELLGDIFKRKLNPRKPLPGHGTTLDKVATIEEVQRMIDERNERIGLPKGLS